MAEALPPPTPPEDGPTDVLAYAQAERASRIEWAHKNIADHGYQVRPPPKIWAGRDQLASTAREVFALTEIESYNLVDMAVAELFDRSGGDAKFVDRRLMLMRLADIRNLVLKAIRQGRRESTFQYDENPKDPNTLIERKVKEKRYDGTDMAAIGRLLEIEGFVAKLKNLFEDENTGFGTAMELFEELERTVALKAGSPAQRIREVPVDQLPVAGTMQIVATVQQVGKKKKQVKSREVEKPPEE